MKKNNVYFLLLMMVFLPLRVEALSCAKDVYIVKVATGTLEDPNGWAVYYSKKHYFDATAKQIVSNSSELADSSKQSNKIVFDTAINAMNNQYMVNISDNHYPVCDNFDQIEAWISEPLKPRVK